MDARRVHGRRRVLRAVGVPDHVAAAPRTAPHRPDPLRRLLVATGPPPAPGRVLDDRGRAPGTAAPSSPSTPSTRCAGTPSRASSTTPTGTSSRADSPTSRSSSRRRHSPTCGRSRSRSSSTWCGHSSSRSSPSRSRAPHPLRRLRRRRRRLADPDDRALRRSRPLPRVLRHPRPPEHDAHRLRPRRPPRDATRPRPPLLTRAPSRSSPPSHSRSAPPRGSAPPPPASFFWGGDTLFGLAFATVLFSLPRRPHPAPAARSRPAPSSGSAASPTASTSGTGPSSCSSTEDRTGLSGTTLNIARVAVTIAISVAVGPPPRTPRPPLPTTRPPLGHPRHRHHPHHRPRHHRRRRITAELRGAERWPPVSQVGTAEVGEATQGHRASAASRSSPGCSARTSP